MKLECGLQLYTLRDFLRKKSELPAVFDFVASTGVKAVELASLPADITAKEIRDLTTASGLSVCGSHTGFDALSNNIEKIADDHLTYGALSVGVPSIPAEYRESLDGINRFCDKMNEFAEILNEKGLSLNYHNHAFEFTEKFDNTPIYDILLEKGNFDFCLDVYWAIVGKVSPEEYIDVIGDRLIFIHMKDMIKRRFKFLKPKMTAPGQGIIDYTPIIAQCEDFGTKCAILEIDSSKDPKQAVIDGMNYLKTF